MRTRRAAATMFAVAVACGVTASPASASPSHCRAMAAYMTCGAPLTESPKALAGQTAKLANEIIFSVQNPLPT
ncbi:MAG TPA: hypothetical protein VNB24_00510 [Acidimicrobiales bacterium]|nr:hypothetical protein [Acidimicrobiales bacterium]